MHGVQDLKPAPGGSGSDNGSGLPWYKELNSYHWYVLVVAALGWLFDTMDQQLFVLVRQPALADLLGMDARDPVVTTYGGYATAIFMVGWASGGLIFGLLGDRIGRARTMLLTILIYSMFTGLSALSMTWWDFAIYRFITGMGVGGEFAAGIALVAEVMPPRARPYAIGLLQALSAVGNMTAAVIFRTISAFAPAVQMVKDGHEAGFSLQSMPAWRWVFLVGIVPALLVVLVRRRLKEPDSWVKAKEATAGGKPDEMHKQLGDIKELFSDPRWRYNTIIGVTLVLAGVIGLWGIGFFTPELVRSFVPPEDQADAVFWTSLLQNAGAFFGIYGFSLMAGRIGRRPAFAVAFLLAFAATILVFGFMNQPSQIWWMIPLLGFCILMVFGGYAIYFPELFPTRLRSTGTGFCYNVARYLAAAGPLMFGAFAGLFRAEPGTERGDKGLSYLTILGEWGGSDQAIRYAAVTLASIYLLGLLVLPFAPETKDKPLPE
jgi:MFS family permease